MGTLYFVIWSHNEKYFETKKTSKYILGSAGMNPFNSTIVYIVNHDICGEFGNSSRNKDGKPILRKVLCFRYYRGSDETLPKYYKFIAGM